MPHVQVRLLRFARSPARAAAFVAAATAGVAAFTSSAPASAQSGGGGGSSLAPAARAAERRKEGFAFSEYLTQKRDSGRLDLLYRFYSSDSRKPKPRVEPYAFGFASTATSEDSAPALAGIARAKGFTAAGYGGELFLNNFVSGTTGLPTLNIVPGVRGVRGEDKGAPGNVTTTRWGPVVRLFGANQQDTALFLSYQNTRRSVRGESLKEWAWQGGGRVYVFKSLALESQAFFNEEFLRGKHDARFSHRGFDAGGYLEFSIARVGYRFEREDFQARDGSGGVREERRSVFLGVAY